jgi:hypothetical protein
MMYVTSMGRLRPKYLPAIYFDSSVLIDYWVTEGLGLDWTKESPKKAINEDEPTSLEVVRELLKADQEET